MKRMGTTLLRPTVVILLGCLSVTASFAQDGTVHERSFVHNDSLRSYLLYVPAAYDGQDAWPLVIDYHGYSIDAAFQKDVDRMDLAADAAGFLAAYPNGLIANDPWDGPGIGWNFDGQASENDDVDFTSQLIDHVGADFLVDPARVHATGWSMGSQMTWGVACHLSNRIASVAGVSGPMDDASMEACDPERPLSAMFIHGTADIFVPPEGVEVNGYVFSAPSESPAFWARHNNCAPDSLVTELENIDDTDNSTVTLIEYTGCHDETEVRFYRVNNGGHTWPGGSWPGGEWPEFLGPVNRDLDASAEILAFFAGNRLVGTATEEEFARLGISVEVYPNPFTDRFTIDLEAPRAEPVHLTLFNVLGQEVSTSLIPVSTPGRQRLVWRADAGSLSPGVYFIRVTVGDSQLTKSLIHMAR